MNLIVAPEDRTLGRARDADIVIADPAVSRRHLRVQVEGGEVLIRLCDGASPFVLRGEPVAFARLRVGDEILLGHTALAVRLPEAIGGETFDARTLVTGAGADVRGLAALFMLTEALEAAPDQEAVSAAVDAWARAHAQAAAARVTTDSGAGTEAVEPSLALARSTDSGAQIVTVPAHAPEPRWVEFELPGEADVATRRLLVVAGRLVGARLAQTRAIESLVREKDSLRALAVGGARSFEGTSEPAKQTAKLIGRLAAADAHLLLEGETGSGKTFVARLIHEASARARAPLTVINCAAIPDNLVESELFGHERGAFTGAVGVRRGAFEVAEAGTLVLDEIGELPLPSQAKLLRALEERRFERVGSSRSIALRARVIAATNRDLKELVARGTFRSDLFFRISVVTLRVPSLRERGEDIGAIATRVLADLAASAPRRIEGFTPKALASLRRYTWPGNVRELRNVLERAIVLGEGGKAKIDDVDLPESVRSPGSGGATGPAVHSVPLPARLDWLEERAIAAALEATGGNRTRAAALLGINRQTLYNKLGER